MCLTSYMYELPDPLGIKHKIFWLIALYCRNLFSWEDSKLIQAKKMVNGTLNYCNISPTLQGLKNFALCEADGKILDCTVLPSSFACCQVE